MCKAEKAILRGVTIFLFITIASATAIASAGPDPGKVSLVRYDYLTVQEVEHLLDFRYHFDIAAFSPGEYLDLLVSPAEREYMRILGYTGSTIIDDLEEYYQQRINYDGFMGNYRTYEEMVQYLEDIAAAFPGITRLYDIGDSWEKVNMGEENNDIWALKISDDPDVEDPEEAGVLYVGAYHAREIITPEIVMYLIDYFTSGYGVDPEVTEMVDNTEIWLVPIVNVDGHITVEGGNIMWRKNRNRNGSPLVLLWGVDLNRNHSYKWGFNNSGSSPFKFMEDYRGKAPASEPEIKAIEDLARQVDFTFSMSYHSYSRLFLFPWSYKDLNTVDHEFYCTIGEEATKFNGYTYGNPNMGAIYNCNGEMDDFMYGDRNRKKKVLAFTSEVGTTFWPDDSKIPELCEENFYAAYLLAKLANNPYEIFPYEVEAWTTTPEVAPGDVFEAGYRYTNLSDASVTLEIWTAVWLDHREVLSPAMEPVSITLSPGENHEGTVTHTVPSHAPPGLFTYEARLGNYPEDLRGNDTFCFTITE